MYKEYLDKFEDFENEFPTKEGKYLPSGVLQGQSIAVVTSGGDSQGMNAAVKAVVRVGIYCGATVYFVYEGLQGLVDGGQHIQEAYWSDVSGLIDLGGTVIGSVRCKDFREREGRLKAAKNLVDRSISNLIVIGGDGSLTGTNIFRQEWPSLLAELVKRDIVDPIKLKYSHSLNIVGLVGSIDNDFCGTEMTIGVDSALTRIIEAVDSLVTTANSHQRCFVIEVMGRHCGYLALVSAVACEAEFVFIPEKPPPENWEDDMCNVLEMSKKLNRVNLILVSEGAIDSKNKAITASYIKQLVSDRVNIDTRITVLGHIQRGGNPTAFDRILGLRQGAEAITALIDAHRNPGTPASVICINRNRMNRRPLMECVLMTQKLQEKMNRGEFDELDVLRGSTFCRNYKAFTTLNSFHVDMNEVLHRHNKFTLKRTISLHEGWENMGHPRVGIICIGAIACGINAAIRGAVRTALSQDMFPLGIMNGCEGLLKNELVPFWWNDVSGIISKGGTVLGIRRTIPSQLDMGKIAAKFDELKLSSLIIIGGFEAFRTGVEFYNAKNKYPEFQIPMVVIPATISNNIPGIQLSLGCDTAVNIMVNVMDTLKIGSAGTNYRIYIVETMGNNCGYLNTMATLAGGADFSYIDEEELDIDTLRRDVNTLKAKMEDDVYYGIVLRSNVSDHPYDSNYIFKLFKQEGRNIFDCRHNSFGHAILGGRSSPFDRSIGIKSGVESILWIKNFLSQPTESNVILIGLGDSGHEKYTPIQSQLNNINYEKNRPYRLWWMNLRPLMRIIQTHESKYNTENIMKGVSK